MCLRCAVYLNTSNLHFTGIFSIYSAAIHSQACYSRIDSDWLSMFYRLTAGKNRSPSDSNNIVPLCLYRYSCGLNIENDFQNYIFIVIFKVRSHQMRMKQINRAIRA